MGNFNCDVHLSRAADVLLRRHFCVARGESVLLTADNRTDAALVDALSLAAARIGAKVSVMSIPQLPFQGSLADPYMSDALPAAAANCDVWLDLAFPYLAGSKAFDEAMKAKRTRYMLLGDIGPAGFARMYGCVDFELLFQMQAATDQFLAEAEGKSGRITSPLGTDIRFVIGKPATKKERYATAPGSQTVPGSAIFYPELESVTGVIVLESIFHEYYTRLRTPITLEVNGKIRAVRGEAADVVVTDRALRRAGGGEYGHVIHLTIGLHPAAVATGQSFIQDIRVQGANAIGLGLPWWLPGGGENHPDGVITNQSMWIDDMQVVDHGRLVHPPHAAAVLQELIPVYS
jgi:2,5-dihydroxypyridine 5,6-dioxygenase